MSFLNFIKDNFNRVLSVDTEFRMDETKTIPKKFKHVNKSCKSLKIQPISLFEAPGPLLIGF